ncbi:class I SAM-dependent methyltransferase [Cellulomonas sp. P22]|uniref:class I SAM-dependent methyltransferase n=1 Tax=Cellulomonas sp. P22 TaxID=3373189 RepID=UPI00379505A7
MEALSVPSPTALMSAAARAAHLLVDGPTPLLVDAQALALCRAVGSSPLDYQLAAPREPVLAAARLSAVVRSRFAEQIARRSSTDQYVVLGAGLDSSGHRLQASTRTWLVDLPTVLRWRASAFAAAEIEDVGAAVPLDLATADVPAALAAAGGDLERPVVVSWLGTVMYLDLPQVERVLGQLSALAPGSHLVFDCIVPPSERDPAGQAYAEAVSAVAGTSGEPWRSTFSATDVEDVLSRTGWRLERSANEAEVVPDGSWQEHEALRPQRLVRLVHASTNPDGRPTP